MGGEGAPGGGTGEGAVSRTTAREGIVAAKAGGKVMDNIGNEGVSVNNDNNGIVVVGGILFRPRAWEWE